MPDPQLTSLLIDLVDLNGRPAAAAALARYLGAEHLLILVPDPELGIHLPARGFPQTLPGGRRWQEFTAACIAEGSHAGELSLPPGANPWPALGRAAADGSVIILLGGNPLADRLSAAAGMLPLLGALFRQEFVAGIAASEWALAREGARQAKTLADALDAVRRDLQHAVSDIQRQLSLRARAEAALRISEQQRDLALRAGRMGTWRWHAAANRSVWSDVQEALFGLLPGTYDGTVAMFLSLVHPDDRPQVTRAVEAALQGGQSYRARYRVRWPNGDIHWLESQGHVILEHDQVAGLTGVTWDITERQLAEDALAQQAQELARSNADLQQFAYITSHDLQEPLRTVVNYAQLLAMRYRGQLDANADEFLNFIIAGGRRMTDLVQDLLSFSRIANAADVPLLPVPLDQTVEWARMNLQEAIGNSGGMVYCDDLLPTVLGNQIQLVQLFQNLISNAIKYRAPRPPEIHIGAQREDGEWRISVRDNGIGIDPEYHEQIFGVFKRLHGAQIPGTGIGLAICRKIVEKHGGRLWVESQSGAGSTFFFTLGGAEDQTSSDPSKPE